MIEFLALRAIVRLMGDIEGRRQAAVAVPWSVARADVEGVLLAATWWLYDRPRTRVGPPSCRWPVVLPVLMAFPTRERPYFPS